MSATFFYAVRYLVNGLCETPLRVGAADGDLETVLTVSYTHLDVYKRQPPAFPCSRATRSF